MAESVKYPIAKDETGKWVKIPDASKGGNYFCPECQSPFIPKLGTIRQHHFAHHPDYAKACTGESGYHNLGKQLLAHYFETNQAFIADTNCPICKKEFHATGRIKEVLVEKGENEYRPDVRLILESGTIVNCEVIYKNPLSKEKIKRYKEFGTPLLIWKIDDNVQVFTGFELVGWQSFNLFYGRYESLLFANLPIPRHTCLKVEQIGLIEHGCATHTKWCPIHIRDYHGKSYANFIDDCACCRFYRGSIDSWFSEAGGWPGGIYCVGKQEKEASS